MNNSKINEMFSLQERIPKLALIYDIDVCINVLSVWCIEQAGSQGS